MQTNWGVGELMMEAPRACGCFRPLTMPQLRTLPHMTVFRSTATPVQRGKVSRITYE